MNQKRYCVGAIAGLLLATALGCSPPPDTSPAVSITSPLNEATVPANQAIDVRFTLSGIDATDGQMVNFTLSSGSEKRVGKGNVRAFIGQSNTVAQTYLLPTDANPFLIPDGVKGVPSTYVVSGRRLTITLQLYYNDDTKVDPQREGTVIVNVQ